MTTVRGSEYITNTLQSWLPLSNWLHRFPMRIDDVLDHRSPTKILNPSVSHSIDFFRGFLARISHSPAPRSINVRRRLSTPLTLVAWNWKNWAATSSTLPSSGSDGSTSEDDCLAMERNSSLPQNEGDSRWRGRTQGNGKKPIASLRNRLTRV